MSHAYSTECNCTRCVREKARRTLQAANDPRNQVQAKVRQPRVKRYATRAEQHALYLDTGYNAWDDRE